MCPVPDKLLHLISNDGDKYAGPFFAEDFKLEACDGWHRIYTIDFI